MSSSDHSTSNAEPAAAAESSTISHASNGRTSPPSNDQKEPGSSDEGTTPQQNGESSNEENTTNNAASSNVDPNTSLSLRALVSTKEAGVVIGKGGSNVAELRDKTGVKAGVSKVVPGVHDRVLSVNGTIEGVASAYSLIAQTILDNPVSNEPGSSSKNNDSTSIRLLISHALMGTIIGKAGLTIKQIQDLSGARMVASKEMLPNSTERIVEVQGTPAAIKLAVQEIAKCLLDDWERGQGTVLYSPEQTEGAGVLAASGAGGLQQQGSLPLRALGGGGRRASAGGFLSAGMGAMSLGGPGISPLAAGRRTTVANIHGGGLRGPAPPMIPTAAPVPVPVAAVPQAPGGVDLLANPATAPYAAHIASIQHQSVFAPTGIPASSATRPSAIADAAAQGAAVAPGGGLVAGGMTGVGPATAPAVVDAANLRTQNISIPSDMVGCIIGKGGSKITEIRRLSGSRISIAKVAHDESGERMFTIQGTPESNEKALFLLYNQVSPSSRPPVPAPADPFPLYSWRLRRSAAPLRPALSKPRRLDFHLSRHCFMML